MNTRRLTTHIAWLLVAAMRRFQREWTLVPIFEQLVELPKSQPGATCPKSRPTHRA